MIKYVSPPPFFLVILCHFKYLYIERPYIMIFFYVFIFCTIGTMVMYGCPECGAKFSVKSNLTRHRKIHEEKQFECGKCGEKFTLQQHLDLHSKQHSYPKIPQYEEGEARMRSSEADCV